jgi:hypothetical protein
MALAVLAPDKSLAYEFDMDRDGSPDLVLENRKLRAVFSPRRGGRTTEFLLKEQGLNVLTSAGSLDAGAPMDGRISGPGRIELRSGEVTRTITLTASDSFLEVEQYGGPADWKVSALPDIEAPAPTGQARFAIEAPAAKVEASHNTFSTTYRLRFPEQAETARAPVDGSRQTPPMLVRMFLEWMERKSPASAK